MRIALAMATCYPVRASGFFGSSLFHTSVVCRLATCRRVQNCKFDAEIHGTKYVSTAVCVKVRFDSKVCFYCNTVKLAT